MYLRAVSFLLSLVDPLLLAMPRTRTKRRSRFAVPRRNPYQKLSKEEIRLGGMWHKEDGRVELMALRLKSDSRIRFSMT